MSTQPSPHVPAGFASWSQVVTDWSVARAFEASSFPPCLAHHPELAVPLVVEIGATIREIQLRRRPLARRLHQAAVTEPAYDRAGGSDYLAVREAMERMQEHCLRRRGDSGPKLDADRAELRRLQAAFADHRARAEPFVAEACQQAGAEFWRRNPPLGLPDDFFSQGPVDSAALQISRINPAWCWRDFFARLQHEFARRHAADGCFLDALPQLRTEAKKLTLDGMVEEWTEARAPDWGWAGPGHHRMLAVRAQKKAQQLTSWCESRAPKYLDDASTRETLREALNQLLNSQDPLSRINAPGCN